MSELVPIERVERKIFLIRGQKVMLDRDLAELYGVETFNLNKAVKRNKRRFPVDFMFQLTRDEYEAVRFQNGILEKGKHSKYLPLVFTEQGVAMLSKEVSRKLHELEGRLDKNDHQIVSILDAIRRMVEPDIRPKRKIGFMLPGKDQ